MTAERRAPRGGTKRLAGHAAEIAGAVLAADLRVVALDYDGTLTEIVRDPEEALLSEERRRILSRVSALPRLELVVLSGRARADAARRLGLPGAVVVGNHGLELEGWSLPEAERFRIELKAILAELERIRDRGVPFRIEDKGPTATLHLRGTRTDQARDRLLAQVQPMLERLHEASPTERSRFRFHAGKASVDVRPEAGWDKAAALLHLLERWGAAPGGCFYAGDDATDEAVFRGLADALTVKVGAGPTAARYRARAPSEVYAFLEELLRQGRPCPTS